MGTLFSKMTSTRFATVCRWCTYRNNSDHMGCIINYSFFCVCRDALLLYGILIVMSARAIARAADSLIFLRPDVCCFFEPCCCDVLAGCASESSSESLRAY